MCACPCLSLCVCEFTTIDGVWKEEKKKQFTSNIKRYCECTRGGVSIVFCTQPHRQVDVNFNRSLFATDVRSDECMCEQVHEPNRQFCQKQMHTFVSVCLACHLARLRLCRLVRRDVSMCAAIAQKMGGTKMMCSAYGKWIKA